MKEYLKGDAKTGLCKESSMLIENMYDDIEGVFKLIVNIELWIQNYCLLRQNYHISPV